MRSKRRLPLEQLAPLCLELPREPIRLDAVKVFGNAQPVELEIGFGKGEFLVHAAVHGPTSNFLGVEVDRGLQLHTASRLVRRGVTNVRLVKCDALTLLRDWLVPQSLAAVHVYFPDPWWKRRHLKRRLVTAEFVDQVARVLRPGGRFHIASDVPEYFVIIQQTIARCPALALTDEPCPVDAVTTAFQRKALAKDHPIGRATYRVGLSA